MSNAKNIRIGTLDGAGDYSSEISDNDHLWIAEFPPAFRKAIDEEQDTGRALRLSEVRHPNGMWEVVGEVRVPVYRLTAAGRGHIAEKMGVENIPVEYVKDEEPQPSTPPVDIFRASGISKKQEDLTNKLIGDFKKMRREE